MKRKLGWLVIGLAAGLSASAVAEMKTLEATYSAAKGIGAEAGVMRRDPSDIIKVGDLYYVWYSKGKISSGYDATVWCATSTDGHVWTEKGMALAKGPAYLLRIFSLPKGATGCFTQAPPESSANPSILIRK